MIIDQWYTSHVDRIDEAIKIASPDEDKYNVIINGEVMATVEDPETAEILVNRLENFNEKYHRSVDTFDISRELELIEQNKDNKDSNVNQFGGYFS